MRIGQVTRLQNDISFSKTPTTTKDELQSLHQVIEKQADLKMALQ